MGTTDEVSDHGGSLADARALFPGAPGPWIDLSTGINPQPYPLPPVPASAWASLPEAGEVAALCDVAARLYGAPSGRNLVAAPGTQILLPLVAALGPAGRARVLGPTYAEHARAARLAGHETAEVADFGALEGADLAGVVNPNNPDGRRIEASALRALADRLARHGGRLVVDEAFADAEEGAPESLAGAVEDHPNLVVLRSFGKFFGLAGARLGFALAARGVAAALAARLGPWAVPGPTLHVAARALADRAWQAETRGRLRRETAALDAVLGARGLAVRGGTPLFRFVRHADADGVFRACGSRGIYLRRFEAMPDALRIGLPPDAAALSRLEAALDAWAAS